MIIRRASIDDALSLLAIIRKSVFDVAEKFGQLQLITARRVPAFYTFVK